MIVKLAKFGDILVSRPAGREAALAFAAYGEKFKSGEKIEIDFDGVLVLAPSFIHEFVNALKDKYPEAHFEYLPSQNSSVIESLKFL